MCAGGSATRPGADIRRCGGWSGLNYSHGDAGGAGRSSCPVIRMGGSRVAGGSSSCREPPGRGGRSRGIHDSHNDAHDDSSHAADRIPQVPVQPAAGIPHLRVLGRHTRAPDGFASRRVCPLHGQGPPAEGWGTNGARSLAELPVRHDTGRGIGARPVTAPQWARLMAWLALLAAFIAGATLDRTPRRSVRPRPVYAISR